MGNQQNREARTNEVMKKYISEISFNFRNQTYEDGRPLYKIYQHCQICGKQRFTDKEMKELSNPKLTYGMFITRYQRYRYCNGTICDGDNCNKKLYVLTGGFNNYMLEMSFDDKEKLKWQERLKKINEKSILIDLSILNSD